MNIVVIGSCTDSSILAKELNSRLQNSIIARVDMLKSIKNLLLSGLNVKTNENIGTYIGDVEGYSYSKMSKTQKEQVQKAYNAIANSIAPLTFNAVSFSDGNNSLSTFDALTKNVPPGTYSFIKVYSGVITDSHLTALLRQDYSLSANSIFVVIKSPKDQLLPVTVSEEILNQVKKDAFAFLECQKVEDVLNTEMFKLLLEQSLDTTKPSKEEMTGPTSSGVRLELVDMAEAA